MKHFLEQHPRSVSKEELRQWRSVKDGNAQVNYGESGKTFLAAYELHKDKESQRECSGSGPETAAVAKSQCLHMNSPGCFLLETLSQERDPISFEVNVFFACLRTSGHQRHQYLFCMSRHIWGTCCQDVFPRSLEDISSEVDTFFSRVRIFWKRVVNISCPHHDCSLKRDQSPKGTHRG